MAATIAGAVPVLSMPLVQALVQAVRAVLLSLMPRALIGEQRRHLRALGRQIVHRPVELRP
jgi:hypothetical protein